MLNDMHRANPRQLFGCGGVNLQDAPVRDARVHHEGVQHAGQMDVRCVCTCSHGLSRTVVAHGRLADVGKLRVLGQRRRLVERHNPLLLFQAILRDAEDKAVGPCWLDPRRGRRWLLTFFRDAIALGLGNSLA